MTYLAQTRNAQKNLVRWLVLGSSLLDHDEDSMKRLQNVDIDLVENWVRNVKDLEWAYATLQSDRAEHLFVLLCLVNDIGSGAQGSYQACILDDMRLIDSHDLLATLVGTSGKYSFEALNIERVRLTLSSCKAFDGLDVMDEWVIAAIGTFQAYLPITFLNPVCCY